MSKRGMLGLAVVSLLVVFLVAGPAAAQRGCELAHECEESLPQEIPEGSLVAWHPISQVWDLTSPSELMTLCYYFGGYYYIAEDGQHYRYSC